MTLRASRDRVRQLRWPRFLRSGSGFSLVELLLVMAIVGIVAAITIPGFVQSTRGHRLRTAARTVVMAGRYARSMALIKQKEMAVVFDLGASTVSVEMITTPLPAGDPMDEWLMDTSLQGLSGNREATETDDEPADDDATNTVQKSGIEQLSRKLDSVTIVRVDFDETDEEFDEGRRSVLYHSNGRCTPYTVQIVDQRGESITIEVDALSSAETSAE